MKKFAPKECSKCNKPLPIVNVKYHLCYYCNYIRLHGISVYENKLTKNFNRYSISSKNKERVERDERLYEYWFNIKPRFCEECNKPLNRIFRNKDGKVLYRFQYSHIITKGSRPDLRWHKLNGNILCFNHHQQWEFGDRQSMSIYDKNQETISLIINNPNDLI